MLQQHVVVRFSNHLCIRQYLSAEISDICKMITSLQASASHVFSCGFPAGPAVKDAQGWHFDQHSSGGSSA